MGEKMKAKLLEQVGKPFFLIMLAYLIVGFFLLHGYTSSLKSLPSPVYGGDLYYQMGCIEHIRSGGNPLENPSMLGSVPGYMPAYALFVAAVSDAAKTTTFDGMLLSALLLFFISYAAWFFFLRELLNDELRAALGAIIIESLSSNPILKYTDFALYVMLPIFLYLIYRAWKTEKLEFYAASGLAYGLLPLCHMVVFIGATFFVAVLFIRKIIQGKECGKTGWWMRYALFAVVAIPTLMLYWYTPIFVHQLKFAYDRTHMEITDFAVLGNQIGFLGQAFAAFFSNVRYILVAAVLALGFRKIDWSGFESSFFLAAIISTFSYFITEPLLHINFIPGYLLMLMLMPSAAILSLGVMGEVAESLKNRNALLYAALIVLAFLGMFDFQERIAHDQWATVGMENAMAPEYASLGQYIKGNSGVDDVFLSTKELSFALNAFSGRKLVVNRWAQQNNQYLDMPGRDRNAAIIFYGNNLSEKIQLIKEYTVKYLFWDAYWYQSEYIFDSSGKIVDSYDPLLTMDTQENRQALDASGVKYQPMRYWLDPSGKSPDVRKFSILMVTPENYDFSGKGPWKDDLDPYLQEVWNYSQDGQKIAALYEIKN